MNTFQQITGAIATAVSTSLLSLGQHLSYSHNSFFAKINIF